MLRDFARTDWQLGGMCCQILWNFSARITSSNAMFGEAEAQELSDALVDLLGQCPFTSLPVHQFRNMLCLFQTKMTCLSTATTTRQCASSLCRCGGTTSGLLPSNFSTASKRTNQISRRSSRPRDEKPHAFVSRATFHRAGHVVLHRRSVESDVTPSCFLFRSQVVFKLTAPPLTPTSVRFCIGFCVRFLPLVTCRVSSSFSRFPLSAVFFMLSVMLVTPLVTVIDVVC